MSRSLAWAISRAFSTPLALSMAAIMPVEPTGIPCFSSMRTISRSQSMTSWALSVLGRRTTWTPAGTMASRSFTPSPLARSLMRTTISFLPKSRVFRALYTSRRAASFSVYATLSSRSNMMLSAP